jgi:uncharacterized protein YjbI with pentapeptide repeats
MPATAGGEAMANEEQVKRLKQGVREWNEWRNANPDASANLRGAHLSGANLSDAKLDGAKLDSAHLNGAELSNVHLFKANLSGANLSVATLSNADLSGANLSGAVGLTQTQLDGACGDANTKLPEGLKPPKKPCPPPRIP